MGGIDLKMSGNKDRISHITLVLTLLFCISLTSQLKICFAQNYTVTRISPNETIASGGTHILIFTDDFGNMTTTSLGVVFATAASMENCSMNGNSSILNLNDLLSLPIPSVMCHEERNKSMTMKSSVLSCFTPPILHPSLVNRSTDYDMSLKFSPYLISSPAATPPLCPTATDVYLIVFPDPIFQSFSPTPITFIANENRTITILSQAGGEFRGFQSTDVIVLIGTLGRCDQVVVTRTQITCQPPFIDPDTISYGTTTDYTLDVTITVGNSGPHTLGQLLYTRDEPFSVIIIVMIAVLGFIVIFSVICGLLTVCGCYCGCDTVDSQPSFPDGYDAPIGDRKLIGQQTKKDQTSFSNTFKAGLSPDMELGRVGTFNSLEKMEATGGVYYESIRATGGVNYETGGGYYENIASTSSHGAFSTTTASNSTVIF